MFHVKLLVYAKIYHIESAIVIEEITKFHDIYKFVCDRIKPDERSIQDIVIILDIIMNYYSKIL